MNLNLQNILHQYQSIKANLKTVDERQFLINLQQMQILSSALHSFLTEEIFLLLGPEIKKNYESTLDLAMKNQSVLVIKNDSFAIRRAGAEVLLSPLTPEELAESLSSEPLSKENLELFTLFCSEKQAYIALNFGVFLALN